MNKVILIGNLVKDNELRQTQTGTNVVTNSIAVRRNYKNQAGEYDSDFINFVAYRTTADLLTQYFKKGDKIGLSGRWQNRTYQNQAGQTIYVSELIVEDIEFIQQKREQPAAKPNPKPQYDDDIASDDLPF